MEALHTIENIVDKIIKVKELKHNHIIIRFDSGSDDDDVKPQSFCFSDYAKKSPKHESGGIIESIYNRSWIELVRQDNEKVDKELSKLAASTKYTFKELRSSYDWINSVKTLRKALILKDKFGISLIDAVDLIKDLNIIK